jgi:ribosomal protein S18 acetylase RimI-like enzyme
LALPFDLARAAADVERSLCDFSLSFGCLPGAATHRGDDVKWCYSGAPRLNRVIGARFAVDEADARIDELLAFYGSRHAAASWFVGPDDTPADLAGRLASRGLQHRGNWTGMAFDLTALAGPEPAVPGLTIATIGDGAGDLLWAQTGAEGFGMPPASAAAFAQVIGGVGEQLRHCSYRFLGYLDGVPSATSALHLADGLAGIYYVATLPAARGRGLATALTRRALSVARSQGYQVAVLQASPLGTGVYRRLGFATCSTIAIYDYQPPG